VFVIKVEAFDWNCQQYIVPRFSEEEIRDALEPLERQMDQLQEDNKTLREQVAQLSKK
jgi:hypothetical protein